MAVDDYTSEDWKKFQAAVSVLKSPILGDSIELEPSAIGEYIHTDYLRSHSTPNISKITELPSDMPGRTYTSPGTHFTFPSPIHDDGSTAFALPDPVPLAVAHNRWRRKSEPYSTPILERRDVLNEISGDERLAEWVAELPESGYGRSRALTAPSRGPTQRLKKSSDVEKGSQLPQSPPRDTKLDDGDNVPKEEPKTTEKSSSPKTKQPLKAEECQLRLQSSTPVVNKSSTSGPPGLVRLHMDTIQKGDIHKGNNSSH